MQTGRGQRNINLNVFSLSELYFLMNLLNEIKEVDCKNYDSVEDILNARGAVILSEHNEIEPPFVFDFKRKIRAVRKGG